MTSDSCHPGGSSERAELEALRHRVAQLERMNEAMMDRIERTIDSSGNAYSVFEANIIMQRKIEERTEALARANKALREEIREKQAAERELAASRDEACRLAAVAERTDNGVVILSPDGLVEWVNMGFDRIFGYSLEEMRGRRPTSILQGPDTDHDTVSYMREMIEQRRGFDTEIVYYTKSGQSRWLQVNSQPISDEAGCFTGFMVMVSDITERKLIMEEIRTLAMRLQMATEGSGVGIWDLDVETGELVWDETMYQMYGIDPSVFESNFEGWRSCVHPDDLERAEQELRDAIASKNKYSLTFRIVKPSGETRHISAVATIERDEDHKAMRVVGINQDITEQVHDQEALRRSAMNLEHSGRISRVGGWELDLRTRQLYWSTQVKRIHEVDDEYVPTLESAIDFYAPGEAREIITEAVDRGIKHGEPWDFVTEVITAKGKRIWVRAMGEPVTENGTTVCLTGAFQDVTQQKRVEIELENARQAAEAANASKSAFLANMSHEIRTPMTAIVGYADLLSEAGIDETVRHDHIETIRRNGAHLLAIINDILDISKIEAGKMTLECIDMSPRSMINEVVQLMQVRATAKNLSLGVEYEGRVPSLIQSDPVRFRQILMNLVGNAIKFTEVGGVWITTSFEEEDGRGTMLISVRDTGIGMSEQHGSRLFKNFVQGDASTTRRYGGTGLGLQISQRLAEMLGGEITFTSQSDVGSEFVLRLGLGPIDEIAFEDDLHSVAIPVDSGERTAAQQDLSGKRVLLVEDGIDNQRLISYHIRKAGAEVMVASNGKEGIECHERSGPFDLILMDMQMPVMDGYTAASELRQLGVRTPIIALTAHAMSSDRQLCLDSGCDDYATKPIDRDRLLRLAIRWSITNAGDVAA
ncbi:MAG: PAS domain-containing protein [Phycisphaerales bacterium]|nr:PAS domain-containing protein [Phycisphaerales bacterium]